MAEEIRRAPEQLYASGLLKLAGVDDKGLKITLALRREAPSGAMSRS